MNSGFRRRAAGALVLGTAMLTLGACAARGPEVADDAESAPAPRVTNPPTSGEGDRPVGREAVESLRFPALEFEPPVATEHEVLGVPIYHLHDPMFPLVDVYVQIRGGTAHLTRDDLGPLLGFNSFIRNGGTLDLPADSIEREEDLLALQIGIGSGGGGSLASLNALRDALDEGLALFAQILTRPAFDSEAVEVWRGQELERVRRRVENPAGLAYSEFNRLLFGDHSVGWVLDEEDLAAERFTRERLERLHTLLYCRDRLIVGVSGDLEWHEVEPRIERFLKAWPPCEDELPGITIPDMRDKGGIYILPREVEQTTIVMAHPGGIRQEDSPDYFASRVADLILGGGFTSRLMTHVRAERGLTYGASSLWTTPLRHEGIVGAVTSTQAARTTEAVEVLLEVLDDFRSRPPDQEEVDRAIDQISNGYVFAFESAAQIVARRMSHRAQELPDGWLERYLEGIRAVTADDVFRVARTYIDPHRMTILLVGDPARFDPGLERFGTLHLLNPEGEISPWPHDPPPSSWTGQRE